MRQEYHVSGDENVIVDVGANIGAFSIYAASRAARARVVALEPHPTNYAALCVNIDLNELQDRVQSYALALSDIVEHRCLDDFRPGPAHQLLPRGAWDGICVECVTLEKLIETQGLSQIDLLKLDIEGAEHEVLLTTSREALSRVRRIAMEYHAAGPKHTLFSFLERSGFDVASDVQIGRDYGVAHFVKATAKA